MTKAFADTSFQVARSNSQDQGPKAVKKAFQSLDENTKLVTTDMVLTEFLAGLSRNFQREGDNSSEQYKRKLEKRRRFLVKTVRTIVENPKSQ